MAVAPLFFEKLKMR